MDAPLPLSVIFAVVEARQLGGFMELAVFTMMIVDWVECITDEITYVWTHRLSFTNILYSLSRYTAFIDVPLRLLATVAFLSPEICLQQQKIATWATVSGTAISELILLTRTHAIYGRSRAVLISLLLLWMSLVAIAVWSTFVFLAANKFAKNVIPSMPGCHAVDGSPLVFLNFMSIMIFDLVVVVLTGWKAIKNVRREQHTNHRLTRVLYRDGFIFFLVNFACSMGTVITLLTAPFDFLGIAVSFTRVMHSCCSCHIILDIRKAGSNKHNLLPNNTGSRDIVLSPISPTNSYNAKGFQRPLSPMLVGPLPTRARSSSIPRQAPPVLVPRTRSSSLSQPQQQKPAATRIVQKPPLPSSLRPESARPPLLHTQTSPTPVYESFRSVLDSPASSTAPLVRHARSSSFGSRRRGSIWSVEEHPRSDVPPLRLAGLTRVPVSTANVSNTSIDTISSPTEHNPRALRCQIPTVTPLQLNTASPTSPRALPTPPTPVSEMYNLSRQGSTTSLQSSASRHRPLPSLPENAVPLPLPPMPEELPAYPPRYKNDRPGYI